MGSWPVLQLKGVQLQVILHKFSSIGEVTVTEPFTIFRPHAFQLKLALFVLMPCDLPL